MYIREMEMIANLIEKQQKEIEDLNEIKQQICNEELITQDYVQDNFIAKDNIREVLKDLDEFDDYFFNVSTLKEAIKNSLKRLLEEN